MIWVSVTPREKTTKTNKQMKNNEHKKIKMNRNKETQPSERRIT